LSCIQSPSNSFRLPLYSSCRVAVVMGLPNLGQIRVHIVCSGDMGNVWFSPNVPRLDFRNG
jgi:hypothetical protein